MMVGAITFDFGGAYAPAFPLPDASGLMPLSLPEAFFHRHGSSLPLPQPPSDAVMRFETAMGAEPLDSPIVEIKNLVAAGVADEVLVQIAYAIGVAKPLSVFVNTYGTAHYGITDADIADKIQEIFDLRPAAIIERFGLKNPIYLPTASYGHMGRTPYRKKVTLYDGDTPYEKEVQFFGWELLDAVDDIKKAFNIE